MGEMIDSRGEEPDSALPRAGCRGLLQWPCSRAHVAFALPSRDGSGHMVELFMYIYPLHLDCSDRNTKPLPSGWSDDHLSDAEFEQVMATIR